MNERMDIRTFLPTADGRTFPPLMLLGRHAGVDLEMERGIPQGDHLVVSLRRSISLVS